MEGLKGMFGKVAPGLCRLSVNGDIAIKTTNGYKSYNCSTGRLTNCENFVFHLGEEFFFVIPSNKVKPGEIILAAGKPKCVVQAEKDVLTVINYEDSTIESLLPERHLFMGNTYFYGKIVSMFGSRWMKEKKGGSKIIKYMMMAELLKGGGQKGEADFSAALPLLMMGKHMDSMFDGIFDFDEEETEEEREED